MKQLSALLLIVSLLLSIFSLSVSALNGTAKVTFHPRLLNVNDADGNKFTYDGTRQNNVPGQTTDRIRYTLYRIANMDADRADLEQGNDIGVGDKKANLNGKNINYFEQPIVTELDVGQTEAVVDNLPYGFYYVVVEDIAGRGRRGEPVIILVPSTKTDGSLNEDIHLYSKLVIGKHRVTVKKLVNGLALDDEKQGPHIKHGTYVMKFRLQKNVGDDQWKDVDDQGNLTDNETYHFTEGRNFNYGVKDIVGLENGEYRVLEEEFILKENDGVMPKTFNAIKRGILDKGSVDFDTNKFIFNDNVIGEQDAFGRKIGNMFGKNPEVKFTINDNDADVTVDNKMRPQITKFIMHGDGEDEKRYTVKGVNPGEEIRYRLDVTVPYAAGQVANMDKDQFKGLLNAQYPRFMVHDSALANETKVTRADDSPVTVVFVTGNGQRHQLVNNQDYWLLNPNHNSKDIQIDFRRGGNGFSDRVINLMHANIGDNRAHFEIEFKVKVLDAQNLNVLPNLQGDLGRVFSNEELNAIISAMGVGSVNSLPTALAEKKMKFEASGSDADRERARIRLSIDNNARIELDGDIVIFSNTVRSQFGLLKVHKVNENNVVLPGAKFDLMREGVKISEGTSDAEGNIYFVIPIGSDIEFYEDTGYLHHNGIGSIERKPLDLGQPVLMMRLFDDTLDGFLLDNFYFRPDFLQADALTYQLQEVQAPAGYEIIKKPIDVSLDALIKEHTVVNKPRIELPFTGGMGTILFTLIGILLVGSGSFLYMNSRRKKSAK